jgi:nucleotide-binding universal stress UspA family protein
MYLNHSPKGKCPVNPQKTMKKIIIGFDLTEMDDILSSYLAFLAKFWQPEQIYILYVTSSLKENREEKQKVWNTNLPIDEFLQQKLKAIAFKTFPTDLQNKLNFIIGEGEPHEEMLHWAVVKEVDLIVVGRKHSLLGSGMLPQQFALHSPCSVLLVPEIVAKNLDTVLVSSDFSLYARKATEVAIDLVMQAPYASLYCQYIFEVPYSWLDSESHKAEISVARREAEISYQKFISEIDPKTLTIIPLLAPGNEDVDFLRTYENAKDIDASLIVVGAKGRSFITRFFDESFTQKLVEMNNRIPLLIVKEVAKN